MTEADGRDKAVELLKRVGLGDRLFNKPAQLSGGQQQRVAIARALANDPAIVLADEPTGNLDLRTGEEIIQMLAGLKDDFNTTIITATHDHKMLAASDRVVYLSDGQITDVKNRDELDITIGRIETADRADIRRWRSESESGLVFSNQSLRSADRFCSYIVFLESTP